MPYSHPWRLLRSLPEITLAWHDGEDRGWYEHETQTLSIRRGMTQAERRSTVRHELEHHFRGPLLGELIEREEAACELAAARDLIDIRKLGEGLAWTRNLAELADELWVDEDLVEIRLKRLHPSERAYLNQRLAHLRG